MVGGGKPGPKGAVSTLLSDTRRTPTLITPSGLASPAPFMMGSAPKTPDSFRSTTGLPGSSSLSVRMALWIAANWSGMTLMKLCSMV